MKTSSYIQIFLFVTIYPFIIKAGFTELYDPMEAVYFSSYSLSASDKTTINQSANGIMAILSTILPTQSTKFKVLLQDFVSSGKFSASEVSTFQSMINTISTGAAYTPTTSTGTSTPTTYTSTSTSTPTTVYQTISTRLDGVFAKITSSTFNPATDIQPLVTILQNMLIEVFGSPGDAKKYMMAVYQLLTRTQNKDSYNTLSSLYAQAQNITYKNKISFLKRISNPTAFIDPIERNLFIKTMIDVNENATTISNADLNDFLTTLYATTNNTNFSTDEKNNISSISNNLLAYTTSKFNQQDVSTNNSSIPNNFPAITKALQDKFNTINTLYRQGQIGDALNMKNNDFYPMIDNLSNIIGDMMTSDYFSGQQPTGLPDPATGKIDEQTNILNLLSPSINIYKAFASDTENIKNLAAKFSITVPAANRIKYLQQLYNSSALSNENVIRLLWHIYYLIKSVTSTDPAKQLDQNSRTFLKGFISILSQDPIDPLFKTYAQLLTSFGTLLDQAITANPIQQVTTTSSSTSTSGTPTGPATIYSSLVDGNIISLRFGNVNSPANKYISAVTIGNDYLLRGLHTSPIDPATQFKVSFITSSGIKQICLESVKYPGKVITYSTDKVFIYQDLILAPKTTPISANQLFSYVKSSKQNMDPSAYCLVNAFNTGYVSLMSDESIVSTDFYQNQPLQEQDFSCISMVLINQIYQDLITTFNQPDTSKVSEINKALKNGYGSWSPEMAGSFFKEIYYWLLSLHSNKTQWQSFLTSPGYSELQAILDSFNTGVLRKAFAPFSTMLSAIQSLLKFNPSSQFFLLPSDRSIMWLSEDQFQLPFDTNTGISFGLTTNGTFSIHLYNNTSTGNGYKISFGELGDDGSRQINLYRNGSLKTHAPCKAFTKTDYSEYQISINPGNISVFDNSGIILKYSDNNYLFTAGTIYIGLSANDDIVDIAYLNGSIINRIQSLTNSISKITTIEKRTIFLNQITSILTSINAFSQGQGAAEKTAMSSLLSALNNTTIFKEILGSIQYFNYTLSISFFPQDYLENLITGVNNNSQTLQTFVQALKTFATQLNSFVQAGLDPIHSSLIDNIINRLTNIRNSNAKFSPAVNDIDFVISFLQTQGNISFLIDGLKQYLGQINTIADRDNFLTKVGSTLVSYIESAAATGNVNESDRVLALQFIEDCKNNSYFKELLVVQTLDNYKKRLLAQVSPAKKLDSMKLRLSNLTLREAEIDKFLTDLTALAQDFKNAVISGGWFNQPDIDAFNQFIDTIDNNSKNNRASGAYFRIYIRRFIITPNYDLLALKLNTQSEDISLLIQAGVLLNKMQDTSTLATSTGRDAFKALFDQLVDTWKIAVIFDPAKLNTPSSSIKAFYNSMADFFNSVATNYYLMVFKQSFDIAKSDIIEDQYEPLEKVATLQAFLSGSLGLKAPTEVYNAVANLLQEVNKYIALHFDGSVDVTSVNTLLDTCINKSELVSVKNSFVTLKANFKSSQMAPARVSVLNTEIQNAITNFSSLSDTQKDNIIHTITAATTYLQSVSATELQPADLTSLTNSITTLISKGGFDNQDSTDLQNAKTTIANLKASAATAQPTTIVQNTPTIPAHTQAKAYTQAYQQPATQQNQQKPQGFNRVLDYGKPSTGRPKLKY